MLRTAVIGCGKIGSEFADDPRVKGIYSHAGAYAASSRARLVAVCDVDGARAQRCATRWSLPHAYTDVRQMLAQEQPDIVSVCTPDATHAEVLQAVIACGAARGILAEKPLAASANDAAALVASAAAAGKKLAVNYIRRYAPGHCRVRDRLAGLEFGPVQSVCGLYSGGLIHNGSHWLDLVRWLVGDIAAVQAFAAGDDRATPDLRIVFANGVQGFLQGCGRDGEYSAFELDIVCSEGRLRLVDSGHTIEIYRAGDNPHYSGYRALLPAGSESGGIANALSVAVEDLIDCVLENREPRCTGEDGVAALRVAEAALASLQLGHAVSVRSWRS